MEIVQETAANDRGIDAAGAPFGVRIEGRGHTAVGLGPFSDLSVRISSAAGVVGVVRALDDQPRVDPSALPRWIIPPSAAGMKTSHVEGEQLLGEIASPPGLELRQPPAAGQERVQRDRVDPGVAADGAVRIGAADDPRAELVDDARRPRADVAEALHDDARVGRREPECRAASRNM